MAISASISASSFSSSASSASSCFLLLLLLLLLLELSTEEELDSGVVYAVGATKRRHRQERSPGSRVTARGCHYLRPGNLRRRRRPHPRRQGLRSPWGVVRLAPCLLSALALHHLRLPLRSQLWWRASARAMAIDCCSCRHHERSRRPLRRRAALTGCPLAIDTRKVTQKRGNACVRWLVVVVGVVRIIEATPCLSRVAPKCTKLGGRTPGSKLPASPPPLPRPNGGGTTLAVYLCTRP